MHIRTILLSTALGAVVACGSAAAADLPSRAAPPVFIPPPTFTWTGLYIGAFAGAHFDSKTTVLDPLGGGQPTLGKTGVTGGGLVGYNYQFQQFVVGVEGEAGYSDRKAGAGFIGNAGEVALANDSGGVEGRIRGRLGFASGSFGFGNALFFVAGGASFLEDRLALTDVVTGITDTLRRDRIGFNVGGGVEVAFTPKWIARVEYIYDDYGTQLYPYSTAGVFFSNRNVKITDNTVRAAIEYKFDVPAPAAVIAKY